MCTTIKCPRRALNDEFVWWATGDNTPDTLCFREPDGKLLDHIYKGIRIEKPNDIRGLVLVVDDEVGYRQTGKRWKFCCFFGQKRREDKGNFVTGLYRDLSDYFESLEVTNFTFFRDQFHGVDTSWKTMTDSYFPFIPPSLRLKLEVGKYAVHRCVPLTFLCKHEQRFPYWPQKPLIPRAFSFNELRIRVANVAEQKQNGEEIGLGYNHT